MRVSSSLSSHWTLCFALVAFPSLFTPARKQPLFKDYVDFHLFAKRS